MRENRNKNDNHTQSGQLLGVSVQNLQYQQIAMLAILQILAEK